MKKKKSKKEEKDDCYMNLLTDFAFKVVFGKNKALLIHLLNEVIGKDNPIKNINYLPTEQFPGTEDERRAVYDLYCSDNQGKQIIFEMQVEKQVHFNKRSIFYITFSIQDQAIRGKWDFDIKPVYHLAIMNFIHEKKNTNYLNRYSLRNDETFEQLSDILNFITIELPKFKKPLQELETELEHWLYCFRHLHEFKEQPPEMKGEIFDLLFEVARVDKLTTKDMKTYKKSLVKYNDVELVAECSLREGRQEGLQEGLRKGHRKGRQEGRQEERLLVASKFLKIWLPIE
jgi:predicted transposase/invertase (TIGR01784 family)